MVKIMELKELTKILKKELPGFKVKTNEVLTVNLDFPGVTDIYVFRVRTWDDASDFANIGYLDPANIDKGKATWRELNQLQLSKQEIIDFVRDQYKGWCKLKKYIDDFNLEHIVDTLTDLGFTWSIFDDSLSSTLNAYLKCHLEIPQSDVTLDIRIPRVSPTGEFYLYHSTIENDSGKRHTLYATSLDKLLDKLTG